MISHTAEEAKYAANPLTHIDFLLFNRMDKSPVMQLKSTERDTMRKAAVKLNVTP